MTRGALGSDGTPLFLPSAAAATRCPPRAAPSWSPAARSPPRRTNEDVGISWFMPCPGLCCVGGGSPGGARVRPAATRHNKAVPDGAAWSESGEEGEQAVAGLVDAGFGR